MSFTRPFLLGTVLWWLSPGDGWDAVIDAVGINCEKKGTTENQGAYVKYIG